MNSKSSDAARYIWLNTARSNFYGVFSSLSLGPANKAKANPMIVGILWSLGNQQSSPSPSFIQTSCVVDP